MQAGAIAAFLAILSPAATATKASHAIAGRQKRRHSICGKYCNIAVFAEDALMHPLNVMGHETPFLVLTSAAA